LTRPAGRPLRQPFQILPAETLDQPIGKFVRCIFGIFMRRKIGPLLILLKSLQGDFLEQSLTRAGDYLILPFGAPRGA